MRLWLPATTFGPDGHQKAASDFALLIQRLQPWLLNGCTNAMAPAGAHHRSTRVDLMCSSSLFCHCSYHSMTPGHPEFPNSEHNTPGVEATTGPLGQGVANAAGMAAAAKMAAAKFNTKEHTIFSNTIVALCGECS